MNVVIVKTGNIYSVDYALKRLHITPVITDDPEALLRADKVIFPGQGEAGTTMQYLRKRRLDEIIKNLKQPVLGICIGMQLLCRYSEEGQTNGLGVFDVDVKRFIPQRHEDKIPHMGWNTLTDVSSRLFDATRNAQYVYFVHSYYVPVTEETIATSCYIHPFSAALHKDNFYATQFHPEKSGDAGERILSNFLNM